MEDGLTKLFNPTTYEKLIFEREANKVLLRMLKESDKELLEIKQIIQESNKIKSPELVIVKLEQKMSVLRSTLEEKDTALKAKSKRINELVILLIEANEKIKNYEEQEAQHKNTSIS